MMRPVLIIHGESAIASESGAYHAYIPLSNLPKRDMSIYYIYTYTVKSLSM